MKVHFSSEKEDWETPPEFFEKVNRRFGFTLDAAASPENAKCEKFYTIAENGLAQDWSGETVWINPPYDRHKTPLWVEKAFREAKKGVTVVALLAARPDTKMWHKFILNQPNVKVEFIEGRLRFVGAKYPAPFPSALVIFNS